MKKFIFALLLIANSSAAFSCDKSASVPVPVLSGQNTAGLRVIYAVNPRFEKMTTEQIQAILSQAKKFAIDKLATTVNFLPVREIRIHDLDRVAPRRALRESMRYSYKFMDEKSDRQSLKKSIAYVLRSNGSIMNELNSYSSPYIAAGASNAEDMASRLVDVHLAGLTFWTKERALDGKPVLDGGIYSEWQFWKALGYGDLAYDIILTNQPIASAEFYSDAVHVMVRDGITVGTTFYSKRGLLGSYVVFSTFPFTGNQNRLVTLRGGRTYSQSRQIEYAGAYLVHELGHMLLHLGHPWLRDECLMRPAPLLLFDEWYQRVSAGSCPLRSDTQMTPGVARVTYCLDWEKKE